MTLIRGLGASVRYSTRQCAYLDSHYVAQRRFGIFSTSFSGHNRWSKIKHDKAKTDQSRHRQHAAFAREIAFASRVGGPQLAHNTRLADAVTKAKREGFPKASIEAAIARGQGKSSTGATLESVTIEGILPGNVGVVVECETIGRARTISALKNALKKAGGAASPSAYLFERMGRILLECNKEVEEEHLLEAALNAGATDVQIDKEGTLQVFCDPSSTKVVEEYMITSTDLGARLSASEIVWSPHENTKVEISSEVTTDTLFAFVEDVLERENDIQMIAMNLKPGDLDVQTWAELTKRVYVGPEPTS